jgi:hypothetical protein
MLLLKKTPSSEGSILKTRLPILIVRPADLLRKEQHQRTILAHSASR